jgi:alpha-mannosidase
VQDILTTVVAALDRDSSLRFVWSEIKWIELFWGTASDDQKAALRRIVKNGQFEFVGAGWTQHDEVTTTYADQLHNTEHGHEYVLQSLGFECPQPGRCIRVAWQIDMFAGFVFFVFPTTSQGNSATILLVNRTRSSSCCFFVPSRVRARGNACTTTNHCRVRYAIRRCFCGG